MKQIEYIEQKYVPRVDLTELNKSFNTLQEGHNKAIAATTELELAISKLDLHKDEDLYKYNLLNKVKEDIANNTVYGNSARALNKLVEEHGNIFSNVGLIGRLKANQDYKTFVNNIENNNSIDRDTKDYYLEHEANQYKYVDKLDENGNVVGTQESFTPGALPTPTVDMSKLLINAVNLAAKQKGNDTITRFIDKNGNIITNPNLNNLYDGEVYNTTTRQWEKLDKNDIWKALDSVIKSTPGALASLHQDYNVALWKHDKEVANNNGKLIIDEITDPNGITLPFKQFVENKFKGGVNASAYYNETSSTHYGKGASTYLLNKRLGNNIPNRDKRTSGRAINISNIPDYQFTENRPLMNIKYDVLQDYKTKMNDNYVKLNNIITDIYGKNDIITKDINYQDFNNILLNIKNDLIDKEYSNNDTAAIINNISELGKNYIESNINYNNYIDNNAPEKIKSAIEFVNRIDGGGILDKSKSSYDDKILKNIETLFKDSKTVEHNAMYFIIDPRSYNNLQNNFGNIFYEVQRSDGLFNIYINKDNYNDIIPLSVFLESNNVPYKLGSCDLINDLYTSGVEGRLTDAVRKRNIKRIASQYMSAKNEIDKFDLNKDNEPMNLVYTHEGFGNETLTEKDLKEQYINGDIDKTRYSDEFNAIREKHRKAVSRIDYGRSKMFIVDEETNMMIPIQEASERIKYGNLIKTSADNTNTFNYDGAEDIFEGYGIDFVVDEPIGKDGNKTITKKTTIFMPNPFDEEAGTTYNNRSSTKAKNTVRKNMLLGNNNNQYLNRPNDPIGGGLINLTYSNGNIYLVQGNNILSQLSENDAISLTKTFKDYYDLLDGYSYGLYTDDVYGEVKTAITNSLANIISKHTGIDSDILFTEISNNFNINKE